MAAAGARLDNADKEEQLYAILMQAPALVLVHSGPDHIVRFVNAFARQVVQNREVLGRSMREAMPELAVQGVGELMDNVYRTGEPYLAKEVRLALDRGDGRREDGYFTFTYQPYRDDAGAIRGVVTFGFEVTDQVLARKQVEELAFELALHEERLQIAMETAAGGIWDYNPVLDILSWDQRCNAIFGLPPDARVQHRADFMARVHPDDRVMADEQMRRALNAEMGTTFTLECRTAAADERGDRWVAVRGRILFRGGVATRMIGTVIDITDRKRVDQEREALLASERQARADSERASRIRDEFLGTVSHELRTPLNAILGWSQLLTANHSEPTILAKALPSIERNARALATLVEDLLDVSRILSGKLRLYPRKVDVATAVEDAIDVVRPTAAAKEITLSTSVDSEAGQLVADPDRLRQIIWNLATNAIKFTPRGGRVRISAERRGGLVRLEFEDTGQGISGDFLPYVWDRFRQADASSKRAHQGLGLGLAIVRHLVELHGGSVEVKSAGLGLGSTFAVSLPIAAVFSDIKEATPPQPATRSSLVLQGALLSDLRVEVVDDDADARELIALVLGQHGAEVKTAPSAHQGLMLMKEFRPDVLVSDIGMAGENGYDLLRAVRGIGDPALSHVPAIALTAYARAEDRRKALGAGFCAHLAKPVEPSDLVATVATASGRIHGGGRRAG